MGEELFGRMSAWHFPPPPQATGYRAGQNKVERIKVDEAPSVEVKKEAYSIPGVLAKPGTWDGQL